MRGALLGLILLLLPTGATAQKSKVERLKVDTDNLTFLTDGRGHFVAVPKRTRTTASLFYRSRRGPFYRQKVRSRGGQYTRKSGSFSWTFWSPQARDAVDRRSWGAFHGHDGTLSYDKKKDKWLLRCGKRKTPLVVVDTKRSIKLRKARFVDQKHQRIAYLLARDDRGHYYYADSMRVELGGGSFRFFVGKPGAMKRQQLTALIRDEVGDVFATKNGRFVRNKKKNSSSWTPKAGTAEEVFILDLRGNDFLVYGALGVYKDTLGTPCDDM